MNFEQTLLQAALTGTQKTKVPEVLELGSKDLSPVFEGAAKQEESHAKKLLTLAGMWGISSRCGAMAFGQEGQIKSGELEGGLRQSAKSISAPENPSMASWLLNGSPRAISVLCRGLAERGLTLPPGALVDALNAGKQSVAIRPALMSVLGDRGRWLASKNPLWSYAALVETQTPSSSSFSEEVWNFGAFEDRLKWLLDVRKSDPEKARKCLEEVFKSESAQNRASFIQVMFENIGTDDEEFLSNALKDRSKFVRGQASVLLSILTSSDFSKSAQRTINSLLTKEGGVWTLSAPDEKEVLEKSEEALFDGNQDFYHGLGVRAEKLMWLTSKIPLSHWKNFMSMDERQLIDWSRKTDWHIALQAGWVLASIFQKNASWAKVLIQESNLNNNLLRRDQLLTIIGPEAVQEIWKELSKNSSRFTEFARDFSNSIPIDQTLSENFSTQWVDELLRHAKSNSESLSHFSWHLLPMAEILDLPSTERWMNAMSDRYAKKNIENILNSRRQVLNYINSI